MKTLAILALAAIASAGAASAHEVKVSLPRDPASAEQAAAYVANLERAVVSVCARAAAPVIGSNYFAFQSCLKATRADVIKKDPTGLYASRKSPAGTAIAAR